MNRKKRWSTLFGPIEQYFLSTRYTRKKVHKISVVSEQKDIDVSDESSPRRKLRREWLKIFDLLEEKEVWALGVANLGLTVRFVCIYIDFQMSSEINANVLIIKKFGSFATNLVIILVLIDFLKWQH
nr:uncharacterized protein LOC118681168 [Bactrocera oleae]